MEGCMLELREIRLSRGLTQAKAALACEVPLSTFNRVEKRGAGCHPENLARIARWSGLPVGRLMAGEEV